MARITACRRLRDPRRAGSPPGVVAALDADEAEKRDLIARLIDRPLAGIFGEFAALQGSELNAALRRGDFGYRAFVLTPALRASGGPRA